MTEIRTHRPESSRPKMNITDRAKQFAPFAALGRLDSVLLEMERQMDNGELTHVMDLSDLSPDEAAQMLAENTFDESEDY
ncbi:MAG: hypothetical protein IKH67_07530 [Lachnospiraceae bacterium]|nr:hypothetical protein [Lachnospiraceae bacterium]MBR6350495.1 hypothetical protein [Lachnospiraceae bacterium]